MSKNLVPDSQNVFVYSSKIIVVEYRHEGQKSQHPGSFENIPEKHKLFEMPHLDRGCLTLGAEATSVKYVDKFTVWTRSAVPVVMTHALL